MKTRVFLVALVVGAALLGGCQVLDQAELAVGLDDQGHWTVSVRRFYSDAATRPAETGVFSSEKDK